MPDDLEFLAGDPPLTPRVEPWLRRLLADPDACAALVAEFGSPVNVLNPAPLLRNAAELVDAARAAGASGRRCTSRARQTRRSRWRRRRRPGVTGSTWP